MCGSGAGEIVRQISDTMGDTYNLISVLITPDRDQEYIRCCMSNLCCKSVLRKEKTGLKP